MGERPAVDTNRAKDAGFTLIEVLIVLVLIGVSAGIVTYALPSASRARTVDQEVALLAARLNIAAERSLINGRYYKLDWKADRYDFATWQDGEWQAVTGNQLSQSHLLAKGATLTDDTGAQDGSLRITPDLLPMATATALLHLSAGTLRGTVAFDGASARSGQVTQ